MEPQGPGLEGTDGRSSEQVHVLRLVTSSFTRGRDTKPVNSPFPTDATRGFHTPHKFDDQLMAGPDGVRVHPGAVMPRVYSGAVDLDGDWPVYDPWTGLRTAGVLGGCMLLALVYILYKTRCGGRAGRARRRWTSKDRLFVEKYKRKVQERCGSRSGPSMTRRGAVACLADAVHSNQHTIATNSTDRKQTPTIDVVTSSNTAFVDVSTIPGSGLRLHDDGMELKVRPDYALSIGGSHSNAPRSRPAICQSSADPLVTSTLTTSGELNTTRSVSVGADIGSGRAAGHVSTLVGGGERPPTGTGPSSMSPVVLLFDSSSAARPSSHDDVDVIDTQSDRKWSQRVDNDSRRSERGSPDVQREQSTRLSSPDIDNFVAISLNEDFRKSRPCDDGPMTSPTVGDVTTRQMPSLNNGQLKAARSAESRVLEGVPAVVDIRRLDYELTCADSATNSRRNDVSAISLRCRSMVDFSSDVVRSEWTSGARPQLGVDYGQTTTRV